jgi:hypothetical protein
MNHGGRTIKLGLAALLISANIARAQGPATGQLAEMKRLDFLAGQWKGEGWIEFAPGQRRTFKVNETVQSKLGGSVLLIEGIGKGQFGGQGQEVVVHNALATASFDEQLKQFRFRAYRMGGGYVDTEARIGARSLEWGFQDPRAGNIRFTISINEKGQWFEVGDISRDGTTWRKFFEMTLDRQP